MKLSTGQEYNPQIKNKVKATFSKKNLIASTKALISKGAKSVRKVSALAGAEVVDEFVGQWAGDWLRSKAVEKPKKKSKNGKEEPEEKEKTVKDYFNIFKAEILDILGKTQKDPNEEAEEAEESTTVKEVANESIKNLGVNSIDDLEELIREMKRTSEEELLKYIADNNITDSKLTDDLIEAIHAANLEVELGLRKQFKLEEKNAKTLERIAKSSEDTTKEIKAQNQDVYTADRENSIIEPKEEKKSTDIMELLKNIIPGIMSAFAGLKTTLLSIAKTIATVVGIKSTTDGIMDAASNVPGTAKKAGGSGLLNKVKSIGKVGARFLGPAAAVASAGMAGYWVGEKINEALVENNINLGSMAYDGIDAIKGSTIGNMFGFKSDQQKMDEIDAQTQQIIQQNKAEQIEKQSMQQQQSGQLAENSERLENNNMDGKTAPIIVSAPQNNTEVTSKSSENLNISSFNVDPTFRRLNEKIFGLAHI